MQRLCKARAEAKFTIMPSRRQKWIYMKEMVNLFQDKTQDI